MHRRRRTVEGPPSFRYAPSRKTVAMNRAGLRSSFGTPCPSAAQNDSHSDIRHPTRDPPTNLSPCHAHARKERGKTYQRQEPWRGVETPIALNDRGNQTADADHLEQCPSQRKQS